MRFQYRQRRFWCRWYQSHTVQTLDTFPFAYFLHAKRWRFGIALAACPVFKYAVPKILPRAPLNRNGDQRDARHDPQKNKLAYLSRRYLYQAEFLRILARAYRLAKSHTIDRYTSPYRSTARVAASIQASDHEIP